MATNQTTNYQLNQWEPTDKVLRTDFNADNLKIDAALNTLAGRAGALETAVAGHGQALALAGNCRVVCGSYTGSGATSVTLTFDHTPMLVVIRGDVSIATTILPLVLVRGAPRANVENNYTKPVTVSWGETSVSWENTTDYDCFNSRGRAYYYTALLA